MLERINEPGDLRNMSLKELEELAAEIRSVIITTVSRTGGHLAPSLGVVELTLALHTVFDSPRDKIIWDVGHQCYAHKLITGRRGAFHSLRQYGGLSGFPKREESPHDSFDTGHSSTSVSAAVGMALARDLAGGDHHIVAVIGDGALTGGMAFEALNHAGHQGTDLIVVLNDNEMSISNNVGALSGYLSRIRTDPKYFKGKEEIENLLRKLPAIGPRVVKAAERLKDTVKYLVVPGMLFEELGFTYLGPIDGHNIPAVKTVLASAKATRGPVLVHVITKKGKGYGPAEENPDTFHGVGSFDVASGKPVKQAGPPTYTQVFGETLVRLGEQDRQVVAITAAMPSGTGLTEFARRFPNRFFDVGIAEQHAVTLAAGLAASGFRPVVAIYSTFLQRAFDQVVHDVCMQDLPVVFALDRAGIVGDDGETHQGLFDLGYLRPIPNLSLMVPKDETELQHMLFTALSHNGPVALRYPRGAGVGVPASPRFKSLPWGRAELLREGSDVAILAVGPLVYEALQAAEQLTARGIQAAVVNMRFVKPLDEQLLLDIAARCRRVVTVEENILAGGFGSSVLEVLAREKLTVEVTSLGIGDTFVEHGKQDLLRAKYGLSADRIVQAAVDRLERKSVPRRSRA